MQPSEVGERTEAVILAALVASGKDVLVPFGGYLPYDLAYEENGKLVKVQCKSGRERNGVIIFRTCYVGRGPTRDYRGIVDFFGVYCHDRGEVYMVPVDDVPPRGAHLRLDPPKRPAGPYPNGDSLPPDRSGSSSVRVAPDRLTSLY